LLCGEISPIKKNGHGVGAAAAAASSTCCVAILLLCFASAFSRRFGDLKLLLPPYYIFFFFFLNAARQKTFLGTSSSIGMLVYLFVCAFLHFAFWSSADRAG